MARLTVEDCESVVANRFDLVILAATRSRDINNGAPISVEPDGDKVSVISLREIAAESIEVEELREQALRKLQSPRNLSEADRLEMERQQAEAEAEIAPEMLPNAAESFAAIEQETFEDSFDSVTDALNADLD